MINYIYIFMTILLTVYGQFIIKWQVMKLGELPGAFLEKILFLMSLLLNGWIVSGLLAAFLAAFTWMAAMTKFPLGYAYPFISLSFVLVVLLSGVFFNETITPFKILGMILIISGVIVGSHGR